MNKPSISLVQLRILPLNPYNMWFNGWLMFSLYLIYFPSVKAQGMQETGTWIGK